MNEITLPATDLPRLSGTVKDAINFGLWFLYEISYSQNSSAKYSLATSKAVEEFLKKYEITPKNQTEQSINNQNSEEMAKNKLSYL